MNLRCSNKKKTIMLEERTKMKTMERVGAMTREAGTTMARKKLMMSCSKQ